MAPTKEQAGIDFLHPGAELGYWLAVVVAGYMGLVFALGAPHIFNQRIEVGEVATQNIIAKKSMQVVDELATHRARDFARHAVAPVLKWDHSADDRIIARLNKKLDSEEYSTKYSAEKKIQVIQSTKQLLKISPLLPEQDQKQLQLSAVEVLPENWDAGLKAETAHLIASCLEPNVLLDTEATKAKGDQAARQIDPVMKEVKQGDLIVQRGHVVSAEHVHTLGTVGGNQERDTAALMSLCLSLLAAFVLTGIFLWSYEPRHMFSHSSIGLICTVGVVTSSIAAFAGAQYPQFIPLPAAALVMTIFLGPRIAAVIALLLIIFLYTDSLVKIPDLIALGTASMFALGGRISDRQHLMLRGVLIGLTQAGAYFAVVLLTQSAHSASELVASLTLQLLGGLSSAIVAIGSLPFLENLFGVVTPFRLAELTDPTQPLLRQLEERAPGTYQHSLAVANLAEAGAKAIGADANLARTGSLYHDIGKLVRPVYFIENQLGNKNPHDEIPPEESRDRVLAHVTDGITLAHKYGLPKIVQDFIPQHQGTTVMAYFYHKACLRDGTENVNTSFYRYPGPKPQSKEAAIVMLADVSEAVTHSMRDPSEEEVEIAISSVFKARTDDGQFTESGMTAQDLEKVKKAFGRVWRTLHHERLKYPSTTTGRMPTPPDSVAPSPEEGCC